MNSSGIIQLLLFTLLQCSSTAKAQDKITINGYIKDSLSGETLIGANLLVKGAGKGITSNQFGYFSLTIPKGRYELLCSFVGYKTKPVEVTLNTSQQLDILLVPRNFIITEEVIVTGRRRDNNVKTAQMGKIDLSIENAKSLPALMGELIF